MQSSAQEVTMLFKLIAATKDSWACLLRFCLEILHSPKAGEVFLLKSTSKDPKSLSKKLKLTLKFH